MHEVTQAASSLTHGCRQNETKVRVTVTRAALYWHSLFDGPCGTVNRATDSSQLTDGGSCRKLRLSSPFILEGAPLPLCRACSDPMPSWCFFMILNYSSKHYAESGVEQIWWSPSSLRRCALQTLPGYRFKTSLSHLDKTEKNWLNTRYHTWANLIVRTFINGSCFWLWKTLVGKTNCWFLYFYSRKMHWSTSSRVHVKEGCERMTV